VDGGGNTFVTGYSASSNVYPYYNYDYTTIGYSSAGVPLWTNRYNGLGNDDDQATAVAVDGSGNVFVTGQSGNTNGYTDYPTIAYSGAGLPLWTNRYNSPGNSYDQATAVAVDRSGNVFVTGRSYGSYATLKYSSSGTALWTNAAAGGPGTAVALVLDGSGNVFVTGDSHYHIGDSIYETWKYSSPGVALWTKYYFQDFIDPVDYPTALAVDASGNVFVTGHSTRFSDPSSYATVAWSGAGVPLWTNRYRGPGNTNDVATAVAVDRSGNVFVTGYSSGSGSSYDYATIKYSAIPPSLTIARTTTNSMAVFWPSPSAGWNLQVNTDLTTTNWNTPGETVQDNGTLKFIIVSPTNGARFYRLKNM
jgi:hypothetical protein